MRKTLFLLVCFSAIIILLSAFLKPGSSGIIHKQVSAFDSIPGLLVKYGEWIIKRDGCLYCHSLTDSAAANKISLENIQQKYPYSWHYHHLEDPLSVTTQSKMRKFPYLFQRQIKQEKLITLFRETNTNYTAEDSLSAWEEFNKEADAIIDNLSRDMVTESKNEKKEIIALLAWLNKPKTAAQIRNDSIRHAEYALLKARQDSGFKKFINDEEGEFAVITSGHNKEYLKRGKIIFIKACSTCHMNEGGGNIGPNLTDRYWLNGNSKQEIASTIFFGKNAMPSWSQMLSRTDIACLVAYINSIKDSKPVNAKAPQGEKY